MMPTALRFALALTIPLLLSARHAAAHAPPEVLQVIAASGDVILATNRGFMFGSATGPWSLLCSEAFGVSTGSAYHAALLPRGRLLVGDPRGLRISDDRGCNWRRHDALGRLSVPALAQHPDARDRLYLTVYGFDGTDRVPGVGGVRRSDDGGETFRTMYAAPDPEIVGSLLVSSGEPGHVYAAVTLTGAAGTEYAVLHSPDGAQSWQRSRVEADVSSETDVTLLAINPANPLEILARASGVEPARGERLLWSVDGGRTFLTQGRWPLLRSAAFSADGASAFVSYGDGLLRARTPARSFEKLGVSTGISSVVADDAHLLASGYFAGAASPLDGVGSAPLAAPEAGFEPLMTFDQVRAHVSCPAPSTAEQDCDLLWRDWATERGLAQIDAGVTGPPGGTANASDAAVNEGGGSATTPSEKKSGCSLSGQSNLDAAWWLTLSVLALAFRGRTRRSRRDGHAALAKPRPRSVHR